MGELYKNTSGKESVMFAKICISWLLIGKMKKWGKYQRDQTPTTRKTGEIY